MVTATMKTTTRWGWRLLVGLTGLLTLNGIILYFVIADSSLMRTASIQETGIGLLGLALAWDGLRRGSRRAWQTLWILSATLLLLTAQIFAGGEAGVGAWYLFLAAGVGTGLVLAR